MEAMRELIRQQRFDEAQQLLDQLMTALAASNKIFSSPWLKTTSSVFPRPIGIFSR